MKKVSKLLIAYDGSSCSDAALTDLGRAGLPTAVDAVVVTVADIILPPPDDELKPMTCQLIRIPEVERHAKKRAERAINEAQTFADRGAKRVKADFPGWNVRKRYVAIRPPGPYSRWLTVISRTSSSSDLTGTL